MTHATDTTAISAHGIIRDFQAGQSTIRVLHGIDADIKSGEMTYVVGESGSGKTTLISIMCGILWPTEGEVKVFGTDIYSLTDTELVNFRLENIGFIFQQYNLIPSIDAAANAAVPLIAQGMAIEPARRKAMELLDALNIGDQAEKLPRQLSGGQQQRVAIARALVHEPRLVVCDEPTSALDPELEQEVVKVIKALAEEGRTMIIVTHDMRLAADVSDHVVFLHMGKIEEEGPPTDVFGAPKTERLQQFLSATVA